MDSATPPWLQVRPYDFFLFLFLSFAPSLPTLRQMKLKEFALRTCLCSTEKRTNYYSFEGHYELVLSREEAVVGGVAPGMRPVDLVGRL